MKGRNYATAVLGLTVLVVLGVIVLTWRPWEDGANSRITASGLVPVLTLLLGQLGSWVISSGSTAQALAVRQAELEHEAKLAADAQTLDQKRREQAAEEAATQARRDRVLEAVTATSELGPALATAVSERNFPTLPAPEFSRARVALLAISTRFQEGSPGFDAVWDVLRAMNAAYSAQVGDTLSAVVPDLLNALTAFEQEMTEYGLLD